MKRYASISGFTLLEILITVSLTSGIIAVVLACFEGGFRVYERVRDSGTRSAEVYLAGETWAQDIYAMIAAGEHTFDHSKMTFWGYSKRDNTLREIAYRAPDAGGLYYVSSEMEKVGTVTDLRLVPEGMDVKFWYRDAETSEEWVPRWEQGNNLPSAVTMRITGEDEEVVDRTVVIVQPSVGEEDTSIVSE